MQARESPGQESTALTASPKHELQAANHSETAFATGPISPGRLLYLQRSAGNASVTALLAGVSQQIGHATQPITIQRTRIEPDGPFATVLENFTEMWHVPDQAIRLLRASPTFRSIAATLNAHYVSSSDPRRAN